MTDAHARDAARHGDAHDDGCHAHERGVGEHDHHAHAHGPGGHSHTAGDFGAAFAIGHVTLHIETDPATPCELEPEAVV